MTSKVLVPVSLGLGLGFVLIVLLVLTLRRVRRRKPAPNYERPYRQHSTVVEDTSNEGWKHFRSKMMLRDDIPEFVIPQTQPRLVQPIITTPTQTPTTTQTPSLPKELNVVENIGENEDTPQSPGRQRAQRTASLTNFKQKRKISQQVIGSVQRFPGNSLRSQIKRRAKSFDLGYMRSVTASSDHQIQVILPLAGAPLPAKKAMYQSLNADSYELLSINDNVCNSPQRRGNDIQAKRKISQQLSSTQCCDTDNSLQGGKELTRRCKSFDLGSTRPAITSDQGPPLASWSPIKKLAARNPSTNSLDLLSINVQPSSRSAVSSMEGSPVSSRQESPDDSPRMLRIFRQSKHQIQLIGATVHFSLEYKMGQRALILNIMRVSSVNIPVDRKQDASLCLSVHLKPDKFIWEGQTKIVQGTENPNFDEIFKIHGFSLSKLHDCALLFRLNDVNVSQTIGEVTFSLRELQPDALTSRSCLLQRPINVAKDKDHSYVGDLLVSLQYDPINWKLEVRIIKARGLPKKTRGGHTDAFVKINVMQDLTHVFKNKTRVQRHDKSPDFNECFEFELTRDQMESTNINMKVTHRGKLREHLIGVVPVGLNVDPMETGYQHWALILDKPNLTIEQWHKIYQVLK